jgi:hypothetical protein
MKMQKRFEPIAADSGLRTNVDGILIDPEDFALAFPHRWRLTKDGYLLTSSPSNRQSGIYLHRLIMNAPKGVQVDHIDGNKLDNRRKNLRLCTRQQNLCNVAPRKNNKSKYKGVNVAQDGKWFARIKSLDVNLYIGRFNTEENAAQAYNFAAYEHHKEFAYYNRSGQ